MATIPTFTVGTFMLQPVKDFNPDGTIDPNELVTATSNNTSVVQALVDPAVPRKVKLIGVGAGTAVVSVSAQGVPLSGQLALNCTVTAPVNLSRIETDGPPEGPFPV